MYLCYDSTGKGFERDYSSTASTGGHAGITLEPGKSHDEVVPVSSACDLSRPGEYQIQLSRVDPDDPNRHMVKSNTITVTVKP